MLPLSVNFETEHALLEAFKAGRRDEASTAFVRRYQRFVTSITMRNVSNYSDVQDITQDVLMKALQSLHRFQGDSAITTWLYRITMNVIASHRRRERLRLFFRVGEAEGERDVKSNDYSPHQLAEHSDVLLYLQTVLKDLPPKQRETFCLRYFDELPYEDISAMLGTSVGGLKANYHLAVKKIAERLRNSEFAWPEHKESKHE